MNDTTLAEELSDTRENHGGDGFRRVMRKARVLLGWMSDSAATKTLAHMSDRLSEQERLDLIARTREAVAARPPGVDQSDAVRELPPELQDYADRLRAHPVMQEFNREGWTVRMANLAKIGSLQPAVYLDHARERTRNAGKSNLLDLARITLPMEQERAEFATAYDEARQRFILTSRNPNFRIVGAFNNSVPTKGQTGQAIGFVNTTSISMLQVVRQRDRYVLRDGNHRALGLLMNGIHEVPVLYKEYGEFDNMTLSSGLFTAKTYLGERPPMLGDYFNEAVSIEAIMPATQKIVVIQALEMSVLG